MGKNNGYEFLTLISAISVQSLTDLNHGNVGLFKKTAAFHSVRQISLIVGEHSTAYLTSRFYSIQLCNYYTIIYTMLLLRSLKDNYKKITLPSIVALMAYWIRNSAFNQEFGVRFPAGALFHKIKLKFKNS